MLWVLVFAKNVTQEFDLFVKLRPVHSQIENAKQQTKDKSSFVFFRNEAMEIGV